MVPRRSDRVLVWALRGHVQRQNLDTALEQEPDGPVAVRCAEVVAVALVEDHQSASGLGRHEPVDERAEALRHLHGPQVHARELRTEGTER